MKRYYRAFQTDSIGDRISRKRAVDEIMAKDCHVKWESKAKIGRALDATSGSDDEIQAGEFVYWCAGAVK